MSLAPIQIWNRERNCLETEKVYGESAIAWLYGTRSGQWLADRVLSGRLASQAYGAYQATGMSRSKIKPFIERFDIDMSQYETRSYSSFNDFFVRQFKPGLRPFSQTPHVMPAFCEARYFAYESVLAETRVPVKGEYLSARALIGDSEVAPLFEGGPMLLARLCPTDYHRYHFPDDCKVIKTFTVSGRLHSVNPVALKYRGEIFVTNERQLSILETLNFGKIAYVEVGALCVGKIVQSFNPAQLIHKRGEEKGYFLFGASTVIVLGEKGRWLPDQDLLAQTAQGVETYLKLGTSVARSIQ